MRRNPPFVMCSIALFFRMVGSSHFVILGVFFVGQVAVRHSFPLNFVLLPRILMHFN